MLNYFTKYRQYALLFSAILLSGTLAMAQDEMKHWTHESEASVVQVGGNVSTKSYSAKQKTTYTFNSNVLTATGRYLQTKTGSTETAKQWDAGLRYDRDLSELWSVYANRNAESDYYAGYVQRDFTGAGGKYVFLKADQRNLFSELGYQYLAERSSVTYKSKYSNLARIYVEYKDQFNSSVSGKLWVEYLPNFTDSKNYFVNYEPSITVMMSQNLSLKLAYLVKYHNLKNSPTEKKEDTTFTTALVAKF